jgi:hypothetical protein
MRLRPDGRRLAAMPPTWLRCMQVLCRTPAEEVGHWTRRCREEKRDEGAGFCRRDMVVTSTGT